MNIRTTTALVAALLLAGCTTGSASTPQVIYVTQPPVIIAAAVEPTTAPTPTAVPTPKPTPTAVPTPEPTPDTRFLEFLNRSVEWTGEVTDLTTEITDDLEFYDTDSALVPTRQLQASSKSLVKWLDAHKPAACYKDLWALERSAASKVDSSLTYWTRWLKAFPYGSDSDFTKGLNTMTAAGEEVSGLRDEMDNVTC